jgi:hypothetical protein
MKLFLTETLQRAVEFEATPEQVAVLMGENSAAKDQLVEALWSEHGVKLADAELEQTGLLIAGDEPGWEDLWIVD